MLKQLLLALSAFRLQHRSPSFMGKRGHVIYHLTYSCYALLIIVALLIILALHVSPTQIPHLSKAGMDGDVEVVEVFLHLES